MSSTFKIHVEDERGERKLLTGELAYVDGELTERARIGFDCEEANYANLAKLMPNHAYRRYFNERTWPSHAVTRLAPRHVLVHSSCDATTFDVAAFRTWARGLERPQLVTWLHEWHRKVSAPQYVSGCTQLINVATEFPLILGVVTIVTAAFMRNSPGKWREGMTPGLAAFGIDTYNDDDDRIRTSEEKFRPGADAADEYGLIDIRPEWGIALNANDPGGLLRAQAIRDDVFWMEQRQLNRSIRGSVPVCAGYWQYGKVGVGGSNLPLPPTTDPGFPTLQTLVDRQR